MINIDWKILKKKTVSPTVLTFFYRRRRQCLKFFSDVSYSAKKYKMVIFKPKPSKF
jgi:hypothetical protein